MKKIILAVAALATSGFAFAQSSAAVSSPDAAQQVTQAHLVMLHQDLQQIAGELVNHQASQLAAHQASQDPFSFCYFKNEAYSLGAVRDGLVCEDTGVHMRTSDGDVDHKRSDPLRWNPVSSKAHRSNG
ncbi:hypothetical protein G3N96_04980 [Burkholderia sp. Se-20373]|uniref:hypothetical protein n=1 Tax=Burkholderia sp. Se-20373 TaxID=2703898 RepID=UPI0019800316|nr:hypothetical protein [Burkholderia sp. Se-20373]MBN3744790.1 hypothetical protein [Burkholderia sp. Se-20373]